MQQPCRLHLASELCVRSAEAPKVRDFGRSFGAPAPAMSSSHGFKRPAPPTLWYWLPECPCDCTEAAFKRAKVHSYVNEDSCRMQASVCQANAQFIRLLLSQRNQISSCEQQTPFIIFVTASKHNIWHGMC
jgi:hypothetical protein